MSSKSDSTSRSEVKKYQDTMLADMGLLTLDDLSPKERKRWKKLLKPSDSASKKLKEMGYSLNGNNNKRSLGSAVCALESFLKKNGYKEEVFYLRRIAELTSIPGLTTPGESFDIEGVDKAIEHMRQNPGLMLFLDFPAGSKKWIVDGKRVETPFHYGEVVDMINPSDDMGWDVIFSEDETKEVIEKDSLTYIPQGHDLVPVGYIPVNSDKDLWKKMSDDPPLPGNDKIILAKGGVVSGETKNSMEKFFGKMWNFKNIVWL